MGCPVVRILAVLCLSLIAGCAPPASPTAISGPPELKLPASLPQLVVDALDPSLERPVGILLLGSDARSAGERSRSDAIMLALISPTAKRLTLISIPRDSVAAIPGRRTGKINGAFRSSPQTSMGAVRGLLGLPVDYYVAMTFWQFRDAVRAAGGIPVVLDRPLRDRLAGANLRSGPQQLGGPDALAVARARKTVPGGDFGRARNQGKLVVGAFMEYVARPPSPDWPQLYGLLRSQARSNIPPLEALRIARALQEIPGSNVEHIVIPGSGGMLGEASVVFPNRGAIARIRAEQKGKLGIP